jgi:hypothetical protein
MSVSTLASPRSKIRIRGVDGAAVRSSKVSACARLSAPGSSVFSRSKASQSFSALVRKGEANRGIGQSCEAQGIKATPYPLVDGVGYARGWRQFPITAVSIRTPVSERPRTRQSKTVFKNRRRTISAFYRSRTRRTAAVFGRKVVGGTGGAHELISSDGRIRRLAEIRGDVRAYSCFSGVLRMFRPALPTCQ